METIDEKPIEPSAEEKAKILKDAAIAKAKEQSAALAARISELSKFAGKTFKPKEINPKYPNQTIKIIKYEGVGVSAGGVQSHLFRCESKNPGYIWTPPATKFLEDHEEIKVEPVKQSEII